MRNLKRFAVAMLVVAMILSTAGFAAAAVTDIAGEPCEEAVEYLEGLGVIAGFPDGTFRPDRTLTRAEVAKIIVLAKLGAQGELMAGYLKGAYSFTDVPAAHWASGYIKLAQNLGIVNGYPDGTYKPENNVTYAELIKMLVEATGIPAGAGAWPTNYLVPAQAAGITGSIPAGWTAGAPATRGDMACATAFTIKEVANPTSGKTLGQSVFGETTVASVEITPVAPTAAVGAAVTFTAVAKDADGVVVTDATIAWATSDASKSAINQNGLFVASMSGNYTVTATADGKIATVVVAVYGVATKVNVAVSLPQVPANNVTEAIVTASAQDANGNIDASYTGAMVLAHHTNNGAVTLVETNKNAVAGVATFRIKATGNVGRTDTLQVTSGTLTVGTATVATVAQVATTITVAATPASLTANAQQQSTVTATVKDQDGKTMLTGLWPITFSISGKGTFTAGGSTASVVKWTSLSAATQTVFSIQGDAGAIVVEASSPNITSGTLTINTYIAGAATNIKAVVTDNTIKATDPTDMAKFTVELVDAWGQPTTKAGAEAFTVTLADDTALGTKGLVLVGATTVPGGDTSSVVLEIKALDAVSGTIGTHSIKVKPTTTTYTAQLFDVVVAPGVATKLATNITTAKQLPADNTVTTVTAQIKDAANNNVAQAGTEVVVTWTDPGANNVGKPTINGVNNPGATDVKVTTDSTGKVAVTFSAQSYPDDDYTLTFTAAGLAPVTTASMTIKVQVATNVSFTWKDGTDTVSIYQLMADAAEAAVVTITIKDQHGTGMGAGVAVKLTLDTPTAMKKVEIWDGAAWVLGAIDADGVITVGAANPNTLAGGTIKAKFTGGKAGWFNLTAAPVQSIGVSATGGFTVAPGTVVAGVKVQTAAGGTTAGIGYTAGTPIELRMFAVDNGGNAIVAPGDVALAVAATGLNSTGANGAFRYTSGGVNETTLIITKGSIYRSIWYVQPLTETPITIAVAANAGAYVAYAFNPAVGAPVGTNPCAVTFTVVDGSGAAVAGVKLGFTNTGPGTLDVATGTTNAAGQVVVTLTGGVATNTVTATVLSAMKGDGAAITAIATVP